MGRSEQDAARAATTQAAADGTLEAMESAAELEREAEDATAKAEKSKSGKGKKED